MTNTTSTHSGLWTLMHLIAFVALILMFLKMFFGGSLLGSSTEHNTAMSEAQLLEECLDSSVCRIGVSEAMEGGEFETQATGARARKGK